MWISKTIAICLIPCLLITPFPSPSLAALTKAFSDNPSTSLVDESKSLENSIFHGKPKEKDNKTNKPVLLASSDNKDDCSSGCDTDWDAYHQAEREVDPGVNERMGKLKESDLGSAANDKYFEIRKRYFYALGYEYDRTTDQYTPPTDSPDPQKVAAGVHDFLSQQQVYKEAFMNPWEAAWF